MVNFLVYSFPAFPMGYYRQHRQLSRVANCRGGVAKMVLWKGRKPIGALSGQVVDARRWAHLA